nr:PucR family transcriptional regulator [uncultured Oscillibacter sp.]
MSFLVSEIFTLASMEDAVLVAGESGLTNPIVSVGIADNFYSKYRNLHENQQFLKNKIMLTSRLPEWPLDDQCNCLRFLYQAGASGLILFQLPDHTQPLNLVFLQTANELRFPVIQMPPQKWSYSDVIHLITQAILHKTHKHCQLSYSALMKLANVPENQRNEHVLLDVLCENAEASIALFDSDFVLRHWAVHSGCPAKIFEDPGFQCHIRTSGETELDTFQTQDGRLLYYSSQRIFLPNSSIKYVAAVSDTGPIPSEQQKWISEVISFFFVAWDINKYGRNSLAQAILKQDRVAAQALAKNLHMKLSDLSILYLYFPTCKLSDQEMNARFLKIEQYFLQLSFRPIMATADAYIAVFLESPPYSVELSDFTDAFQKKLGEFDDQFILFSHMQQNIAAEDFFCSVAENMAYARKVYPHKTVYTLQEILFVQSCIEIVHQGQEAVNRYLNVTKPQMKNTNLPDELWNTLAVYLLDADGSVDATASYLYVHTSTVKYRIKRLNEYLGYNIRKMPENYSLYIALAITRLTT